MIILFIHKGFPGQFQHLAPLLATDPKNIVLFLTEDDKIESVKGINKIVFKPTPIAKCTNPCLQAYEDTVFHARGAAGMLYMMKQQNIIPDIIYAHNGDIALFAKDIFPNIPLICYCEWYDNTNSPAITFGGKKINDNYKKEIITRNSAKIAALSVADACLAPTEWQKKQFPKCFHNKIEVFHDGVNTDTCKPDDNATFEFEGKKYTKNDEIITYATRGMEPMRGFPEFMKAAEILLKKRPNAHIFIGGIDKVFYGEKLKSGTYKELMLKQLDLDLNRLHFTNEMDFDQYIKLMQITSAHVYATYPFVLSWSLVETMSMACPIIASSTQPVLEVIKDNYNGLLYDFYDIEKMVEKIEYALDNKDKMKSIRENARKTVIEKYDMKDMLAKHILFIQKNLRKK